MRAVFSKSNLIKLYRILMNINITLGMIQFSDFSHRSAFKINIQRRKSRKLNDSEISPSSELNDLLLYYLPNYYSPYCSHVFQPMPYIKCWRPEF